MRSWFPLFPSDANYDNQKAAYDEMATDPDFGSGPGDPTAAFGGIKINDDSLYELLTITGQEFIIFITRTFSAAMKFSKKYFLSSSFFIAVILMRSPKMILFSAQPSCHR